MSLLINSSCIKQEEDKYKNCFPFFYTEDKMSVGEMEVIKVLLVLSFTLSSGNARKVTFHAFIMQHYTDAEIRLTVPLAKMIATVRVIPNPEI